MNGVLVALILLPAAAGLVELLAARLPSWQRFAGLCAHAGAAASFVCAALLTASVAAGGHPFVAGAYLRADSLGALVALLASFLTLVGIAAARRHLGAYVSAGRARPEWLPVLHGCSALFLAAANWTALADHVIVLYIAVEATTLATVLPVAFYRQRTSWEAAYKYLLLNTIGLTAGLLGLAVLYAAAEPVLGSEALRLSGLASVGRLLPPLAAALSGALLIGGFGTKAGLVPLHGWLPDAYQVSPPGFIALFSGIGTKIPMVALARVLPPLTAAAPELNLLLLVAAAVTMLFGILAAFRQDDLRRLLGYSSVSQMGYIAMALAAGGTAGLGAAAYHIVSHGLIKALLFLAVGEVVLLTGTARISEVSGRPLPPQVGWTFLLASLGLGGVPPLPAFWSKFQVFTAVAGAGYGWAAGVAVLTSLLTITTLVWAGARAFLLKPAHGGAVPSAAPPWTVGLLVLAVLAAGLFPAWISGFLASAASAVLTKGV
ncbi:hydrogenase-4 component F [Symbiobacterium terraclitae]|uniref:Hydrogenase-4 component F n=1 Tax=Symbiobacterium terraclitae TaxID=557451 RepID=A0ABS4JTM2_9FIRM|nr:hydrogenase-4 component F [Symbiobacterium terraclitae]